MTRGSRSLHPAYNKPMRCVIWQIYRGVPSRHDRLELLATISGAHCDVLHSSDGQQHPDHHGQRACLRQRQRCVLRCCQPAWLWAPLRQVPGPPHPWPQQADARNKLACVKQIHSAQCIISEALSQPVFALMYMICIPLFCHDDVQEDNREALQTSKVWRCYLASCQDHLSLAGRVAAVPQACSAL